jgi:hypothetical protein
MGYNINTEVPLTAMKYTCVWGKKRGTKAGLIAPPGSKKKY